MEQPMEMPVMKIDKKQADPISAVQNHLETKYGKTEAAAKLQAMSASDLIELSKDMEVKDNEANDMPEMKFKRKENK